MEFNNNGSLNINLTNDELDKLLCWNENDNLIITSTAKQQNYLIQENVQNESIFSKSSQFEITINSLKFDSGNSSSNIFMENSHCINLCTKETETNRKIGKINSLPVNFTIEKFDSLNHGKALSENQHFSTLKSKVEPSISITPESFDIFSPTLNNSFNSPHFNSAQNSNYINQKYSQLNDNDNEDNLTISGIPTNISLQKDLTGIPLSIIELYQSIDSSYSDFAFVYAISAQMCQEFIPMDSYINLKMSLLLSIASLSRNNDKPIQIVAIGPDSILINRIMLHIGQNLPKRFIAPINDLGNIGGQLTNENIIEAGPGLLANGGICYLGDWYHMKSNHADKILKEIEHSTLTICKSNLNYPLKCSIWCYWTGSFRNNIKDRRTINTFMEIFGIPVMLDEKAGGNVLIDFIFEQAVTPTNDIPNDELAISLNDMKDFLKIVGNRKINFNPEAMNSMQKYFLASRIDRPDCLTQQSFITLKKYSESFAKLSLRHTVINSDVIAAIYLAECTIQNIFGYGIYPSPQFLSINNHIEEVDNFMKKFEKWLKDYINRFN